jgi:YggT family protein
VEPTGGHGVMSARPQNYSKNGRKITLKTLTNLTTFMNSLILANWILAPLFGIMIFLFIFRIVLTWYPQVELSRFPFNLIVLPTEPLLAPIRKLVAPIGGVDISPIIWVGIFSLLREILLGQQGLIKMMF